MNNLVSVALATTLLFACSKAEKFNGNNYVNKANDGVQITLSFANDEDRLSGKVVNNYFANYSINGNKFVVDGVGSTMMMGPQNAMEVEQKYFEFMNNSPIEYEVKDDKLILKNKTGQVMVFDKIDSNS